MPGWGPIGQYAVGELPVSAQTQAYGGAFSSFGGIRKAGLAVAVIATTTVGFVAPQPARSAVFASFSQPQRKAVQTAAWQFVAPQIQSPSVFSRFSIPQAPRVNLPDEQPSALFEVLPPPASPFTGFARFSEVLTARSRVFLYASFQPGQLFVPAPDTHDLVFMGDQFRKKKRRPDIVDEEVARRAKLRADINLAVYGPEVTYEPPAPVEPPKPAPPPNVEEIARIFLARRNADLEAAQKAVQDDDEDVLEMILRDL